MKKPKKRIVTIDGIEYIEIPSPFIGGGYTRVSMKEVIAFKQECAEKRKAGLKKRTDFEELPIEEVDG